MNLRDLTSAAEFLHTKLEKVPHPLGSLIQISPKANMGKSYLKAIKSTNECVILQAAGEGEVLFLAKPQIIFNYN